MGNGKKKDKAEEIQDKADAEGKKPRQKESEEAEAADIPLGTGMAESAKKALIRRKKLLEDI